MDRAVWPSTVAMAEPLIRRLPDSFSGQAGETYVSPAATDDGGEGASAGVSYGDDTGLSIAEAYTTTDTENGEPEPMTAHDLMSAHFLIGYTCAAGSYRGTARPTDDRLGPAPTQDQPDGPVWFSCRIDNAEGDEDYTGHVVGWISGNTAWQVLAAGPDSVRSLVAVIHEAAG